MRDFHFSIDRGGTFTDVYALVSGFANERRWLDARGCSDNSACIGSPSAVLCPCASTQVPNGSGGVKQR